MRATSPSANLAAAGANLWPTHVELRSAIAKALSIAPLVLAMSGCGRFDSVEGYHLNLDLPRPRDFSISTSDPRWRPVPDGGIPGVVCRGAAALTADCCLPPSPAEPIDCQQYPMICDDLDGFCAMAFSYDDPVVIDLADQVPELHARRKSVSLNVTLTGVDVVISGNDNLPLRQLDLYVAAKDAVRASDATAVHITEIPLVWGRNHVDIDSSGQQAFASQATDFNSPFALILAARLVSRHGPVPAGSITVGVAGALVASF